MKLTKYLMIIAAGLCVLSGCEWDSSSDGNSTWDSSSSWVNFSGMYKQSGGGLIVVGYPTGSSSSSNTPTPTATVSGTTGTSTQTIGTGGSNNRAFSGTLSTRPILPSSVSVSDGVELLRDDGSGVLDSVRAGNGTVNYTSGAISVIFELPPVVGAPVVVTYSWSTTNSSGGAPVVPGGGGGSSQNATASDKPIYSFFVSQQGNKLYIRDSNGVEYNGELGSVANTGGETTGLTSGYIIAQFTAVDADGNKLLGTFQGDYLAPEVPTNPSQTAPSGLLANRTMQGTYMHHDGVHNGDINAVAADDIQITVNPYAPTNSTNAAQQAN